MGDAAGIGPEVVIKALISESVYRICRPLVIGEKSILQKAIALVKSQAVLHPVEGVDGARSQYGVIDLLDLHNLDENVVTIGQVCQA